MPPLGPTTLAVTSTTTLLFGSANALGEVAVGDSGNSDESIWRVTDVVNGIYQFDDNGQYSGQRGPDGEHCAYDIGDVLAHEFGHWFGLPDDPADPTAIMYPYFDPGETRRKSLSDGDKQALIDLYANNASDDHKPASCSVGVIPSRSRPAIYLWAGIGLIGVSQLLRRRQVTVAVESAKLPVAQGPLDPNDLRI